MTTVAQPHQHATARRRRSPIPTIAWWVIGACLAFGFMAPIVIGLLSSFKTRVAASESNPSLFPAEWSVENYQGLEGVGTGMASYIGNSVVVAIATVLGTIVVATMAGYGFEKLGFYGRNTAFLVIVAMLMVPFQAVVTPLYLILDRMGMVNSLIGLTLVYITYQLPFAIFVMRNSFATVPIAVEEAATVDGASNSRIFRSIMLPLVRPGIITAALFAFFNAWNEFFAALILLTDQTKYTLPIALTLLQGSFLGQIDWGLLQAGVMVAMIPCIVIYVILQRYYAAGLLAGGVK